MATTKRSTSLEDRLKRLQAQIDVKKKRAELKQQISSARDALKKLKR